MSTRQEAVAVIRRREDPAYERMRGQAGEDAAAYFTPVNPTDAAQEVLIEDQARLYAFAGQPVTRDTLRTAPRSVRERLRSLEPVYAEGTTFRCESTRIAVDQQTLHVRTGVAEELLTSSEESQSPDRDLERRREYYRQGRNGNGYRLVRGEAAANGRELSVLTSSDGCMLSVTLE